MDTDSNKPSNENVIQKNKLSDINLEYKIFTNQHDEITKAENLENREETTKLTKNFGSTVSWFPRYCNKTCK